MYGFLRVQVFFVVIEPGNSIDLKGWRVIMEVSQQLQDNPKIMSHEKKKERARYLIHEILFIQIRDPGVMLNEIIFT